MTLSVGSQVSQGYEMNLLSFNVTHYIVKIEN